MSERFRYVYLRNDQNHPVAVVAYLLHKDSDQLNYGVATFNPNDRVVVVVKTGRELDQLEDRKRKIVFDRKFLREIAVGRLCTDRKMVILPAKQDNGMGTITKTLMQTIKRDNALPGRVRKAARLWLRGGPRKTVINEREAEQ